MKHKANHIHILISIFLMATVALLTTVSIALWVDANIKLKVDQDKVNPTENSLTYQACVEDISKPNGYSYFDLNSIPEDAIVTGYAVSDYSGSQSKVLIPDTYSGLPVLHVLKGNKDLFSGKEVILGENITWAETDAFKGATSVFVRGSVKGTYKGLALTGERVSIKNSADKEIDVLIKNGEAYISDLTATSYQITNGKINYSCKAKEIKINDDPTLIKATSTVYPRRVYNLPDNVTYEDEDSRKLMGTHTVSLSGMRFGDNKSFKTPQNPDGQTPFISDGDEKFHLYIVTGDTPNLSNTINKNLEANTKYKLTLDGRDEKHTITEAKVNYQVGSANLILDTTCQEYERYYLEQAFTSSATITGDGLNKTVNGTGQVLYFAPNNYFYNNHQNNAVICDLYKTKDTRLYKISDNSYEGEITVSKNELFNMTTNGENTPLTEDNYVNFDQTKLYNNIYFAADSGMKIKQAGTCKVTLTVKDNKLDLWVDGHPTRTVTVNNETYYLDTNTAEADGYMVDKVKLNFYDKMTFDENFSGAMAKVDKPNDGSKNNITNKDGIRVRTNTDEKGVSIYINYEDGQWLAWAQGYRAEDHGGNNWQSLKYIKVSNANKVTYYEAKYENNQYVATGLDVKKDDIISVYDNYSLDTETITADTINGRNNAIQHNNTELKVRSNSKSDFYYGYNSSNKVSLTGYHPKYTVKVNDKDEYEFDNVNADFTIYNLSNLIQLKGNDKLTFYEDGIKTNVYRVSDEVSNNLHASSSHNDFYVHNAATAQITLTYDTNKDKTYPFGVFVSGFDNYHTVKVNNTTYELVKNAETGLYETTISANKGDNLVFSNNNADTNYTCKTKENAINNLTSDFKVMVGETNLKVTLNAEAGTVWVEGHPYYQVQIGGNTYNLLSNMTRLDKNYEFMVEEKDLTVKDSFEIIGLEGVTAKGSNDPKSINNIFVENNKFISKSTTTSDLYLEKLDGSWVLWSTGYKDAYYVEVNKTGKYYEMAKTSDYGSNHQYKTNETISLKAQDQLTFYLDAKEYNIDYEEAYGNNLTAGRTVVNDANAVIYLKYSIDINDNWRGIWVTGYHPTTITVKRGEVALGTLNLNTPSSADLVNTYTYSGEFALTVLDQLTFYDGETPLAVTNASDNITKVNNNLVVRTTGTNTLTFTINEQDATVTYNANLTGYKDTYYVKVNDTYYDLANEVNLKAKDKLEFYHNEVKDTPTVRNVWNNNINNDLTIKQDVTTKINYVSDDLFIDGYSVDTLDVKYGDSTINLTRRQDGKYVSESIYLKAGTLLRVFSGNNNITAGIENRTGEVNNLREGLSVKYSNTVIIEVTLKNNIADIWVTGYEETIYANNVPLEKQADGTYQGSIYVTFNNVLSLAQNNNGLAFVAETRENAVNNVDSNLKVRYGNNSQYQITLTKTDTSYKVWLEGHPDYHVTIDNVDYLLVRNMAATDKEEYLVNLDLVKGKQLAFNVKATANTWYTNNIDSNLVIRKDATAANIILQKENDGSFKVWVDGYTDEQMILGESTLLTKVENSDVYEVTTNLKVRDTLTFKYGNDTLTVMPNGNNNNVNNNLMVRTTANSKITLTYDNGTWKVYVDGYADTYYVTINGTNTYYKVSDSINLKAKDKLEFYHNEVLETPTVSTAWNNNIDSNLIVKQAVTTSINYQSTNLFVDGYVADLKVKINGGTAISLTKQADGSYTLSNQSLTVMDKLTFFDGETLLTVTSASGNIAKVSDDLVVRTTTTTSTITFRTQDGINSVSADKYESAYYIYVGNEYHLMTSTDNDNTGKAQYMYTFGSQITADAVLKFYHNNELVNAWAKAGEDNNATIKDGTITVRQTATPTVYMTVEGGVWITDYYATYKVNGNKLVSNENHTVYTFTMDVTKGTKLVFTKDGEDLTGITIESGANLNSDFTIHNDSNGALITLTFTEEKKWKVTVSGYEEFYYVNDTILEKQADGKTFAATTNVTFNETLTFKIENEIISNIKVADKATEMNNAVINNGQIKVRCTTDATITLTLNDDESYSLWVTGHPQYTLEVGGNTYYLERYLGNTNAEEYVTKEAITLTMGSKLVFANNADAYGNPISNITNDLIVKTTTTNKVYIKKVDNKWEVYADGFVDTYYVKVADGDYQALANNQITLDLTEKQVLKFYHNNELMSDLTRKADAVDNFNNINGDFSVLQSVKGGIITINGKEVHVSGYEPTIKVSINGVDIPLTITGKEYKATLTNVSKDQVVVFNQDTLQFSPTILAGANLNSNFTIHNDASNVELTLTKATDGWKVTIGGYELTPTLTHNGQTYTLTYDEPGGGYKLDGIQVIAGQSLEFKDGNLVMIVKPEKAESNMDEYGKVITSIPNANIYLKKSGSNWVVWVDGKNSATQYYVKYKGAFYPMIDNGNNEVKLEGLAVISGDTLDIVNRDGSKPDKAVAKGDLGNALTSEMKFTKTGYANIYFSYANSNWGIWVSITVCDYKIIGNMNNWDFGKTLELTPSNNYEFYYDLEVTNPDTDGIFKLVKNNSWNGALGHGNVGLGKDLCTSPSDNNIKLNTAGTYRISVKDGNVSITKLA